MAKRKTAQPMTTSPGATPNQLRAWAYLGAWELVVDIVAEFPGILTQLVDGHAPARRAVDALSIDDMARHAPTNGHGGPAPGKPYTRRLSPAVGRRKPFTAAQRAALADRMRKQWRKAKREGKKSLRPDGAHVGGRAAKA